MPTPNAPVDPSVQAELLDLLGDAARSLAGEPTVQQTLDAVVHYARDMIGGCADAGISLSKDGQLSTPAATDPGVRAPGRD